MLLYKFLVRSPKFSSVTTGWKKLIGHHALCHTITSNKRNSFPKKNVYGDIPASVKIIYCSEGKGEHVASNIRN